MNFHLDIGRFNLDIKYHNNTLSTEIYLDKKRQIIDMEEDAIYFMNEDGERISE